MKPMPFSVGGGLFDQDLDQDLTLNLGRQGSAQAMTLGKQKNWDQAQTTEQKPRWTWEIRDASGMASEDLVNRQERQELQLPWLGAQVQLPGFWEE